MKKLILVSLVLTLLLCACGTAAPDATTPTGYDDGVQQPQMMYDGALYYYEATGFDEALPTTYAQVGEVETVDNDEPPVTDFCGSRVDVGQKVYADADHADVIYLQYEDGYARFSLKSE